MAECLVRIQAIVVRFRVIPVLPPFRVLRPRGTVYQWHYYGLEYWPLLLW